MKLFDVYPINDITIEKGLGSHVWDNHGQRYLDMYGGHAVISIGHSHPHYVATVSGQLATLGFYSNSIKIPLQEQLAQKLGAVSGKTNYQLFLCNSGAEANENALKLASFHTGRKKVIAFSRSFHGRTSLAVAATDNNSILAPVNETDHIIFLPFNDVAALTDCFKQQGNEIAAVIVEAIQGVGGINVASSDFIQCIRQMCTQYAAVCIADEVQCGYGRSGDFYAFDRSGETADIYTMAKGMGNGFPVGGIAIAPHILPRHGMLGTTFGGNHLACAAAIAVLDVIASEDLLSHAKEMGGYIIDSLMKIPGILNVRGAGLMIGFDVPAELKELRKALLNRKFIFTGEAKPNTVRLLPALNISKADADEFLTALKATISELTTTNPG
ncbi:MAG: aminotransferase class III-fold pyridoxal phosphate-dependent enzyme [Taibaiella sp.]|nr:aminotransferase class III-fold pyridoxal phosphate-dependent enzyme [Taibaiella sp.]